MVCWGRGLALPLSPVAAFGAPCHRRAASGRSRPRGRGALDRRAANAAPTAATRAAPLSSRDWRPRRRNVRCDHRGCPAAVVGRAGRRRPAAAAAIVRHAAGGATKRRGRPNNKKREGARALVVAARSLVHSLQGLWSLRPTHEGGAPPVATVVVGARGPAAVTSSALPRPWSLRSPRVTTPSLPTPQCPRCDDLKSGHAPRCHPVQVVVTDQP